MMEEEIEFDCPICGNRIFKRFSTIFCHMDGDMHDCDVSIHAPRNEILTFRVFIPGNPGKMFLGFQSLDDCVRLLKLQAFQ